jgi:hypothetical protein
VTTSRGRGFLRLNEEAANNLLYDNKTLNLPYDKLNLKTKLEKCNIEINKINKQFTGEQKAFQDYLKQYRQWELLKKNIVGGEDIVGSLLYIKKSILYIENNARQDLITNREVRIGISLEIFNKKLEIKNFYDDIKVDIDAKLESSKTTEISIDSAFYLNSKFTDTFFRDIFQNKTGSFYGKEEGNKLLQERLIANTDWSCQDSLKKFLIDVIEFLEKDMRSPEGKILDTFIGKTVKNRANLYEHLFCLKYLEPRYDLKQNDKKLELLSPGEKGALLLVFYLVLDQEDIPLIIDQPEDNLDNKSVAQFLVPFIMQAKKHRQIIMVTHNPNLAVVSDSEQVIRVKIDKGNGNAFSFVSGGVESKEINDEIVDVLEGTIPAFTNRKNKYTTVMRTMTDSL